MIITSEEQIADQKKRKLKEKERKVDWWELRKAPDTEFKVRSIKKMYSRGNGRRETLKK